MENIKEYDGVISVGCSYSIGANICDTNKISTKDKYTYTKLVADEFGIPFINLGKPGAGNQYIIRTLYDFLSTNTTFSNPLVLIATSGLSRWEYKKLDLKDKFFDHHIFDFHLNNDDCPNYTNRAKKLHDDTPVDEYRQWVKFTQRYIYDQENEKNKAEQDYHMISIYLKYLGFDYVIFNSLMNVVSSRNHGDNYLSFKPEEVVTKTVEGYAYNDARQHFIEEPDDCWYHNLFYRHNIEYGDFDPINRSSVPPHGKFFCGGHPSPAANLEIKKYILEKIQII